MFGRKKADESTGSTAVGATSEPVETAPADGRKGRPTPSRKEQEAARKRPLVPADRKIAKAESRQAERERRAVAQAGMAAGDERYLGPRDRGPQRRFARDWIDSRFNIGEFVLIFLILMLFILFLPNQAIGLTFIWIMYGYIALCVIDAFITTTRMKSVMQRKFGEVQRGTRWYAAMRTFTIRRLRLPKPQVRRGERPA
ncbi:MAG: DUF3043 domain-containing protein [Kocuria sp.]|nr:DUF3043 domain-containing protein [Kocuria sp.]